MKKLMVRIAYSATTLALLALARAVSVRTT